MVRASNTCRSGLPNCSVKAAAKGEGRTEGIIEVACGVGESAGGFTGIEPIRRIMSVRVSSGRIEWMASKMWAFKNTNC